MVSNVFHNWVYNITKGENSKQDVVQAYVSQGNVFFDPDTRTIYSYGYHFPMARIVTNPKGEEAVVFTKQTHSKTTSAHLSSTRSAISHMPIFDVPEVHPRSWTAQDWKEAFDALVNDAHEKFVKAARARDNGPYLTEEGEELLEQAFALAKFTGLRCTRPQRDDKRVARMLKEQAKKRADQRAETKRRRAAEHARDEADFQKFIAGKSQYCPHFLRDDSRAKARFAEIAAEVKVEDEANFQRFIAGEIDVCPFTWRNDARAVARKAELNEAYRLERIANEERKRAEDAASFTAWLNGGPGLCPWSYRWDSNGSAHLRTIGHEVQTSQDAVVPLSHAIRAYRFVKLCRMAGRTYEQNGHSVRVGHFMLARITAEGNVTVGCHFFTWERLNEWAIRQGIAEVTASDQVLSQTSHA